MKKYPSQYWDHRLRRKQVLDILRIFPSRFAVIALTAGKNVDLLASQVKEFHPAFVHFNNKQPAL